MVPHALRGMAAAAGASVNTNSAAKRRMEARVFMIIVQIPPVTDSVEVYLRRCVGRRRVAEENTDMSLSAPVDVYRGKVC
jgi:hypothetical protein